MDYLETNENERINLREEIVKFYKKKVKNQSKKSLLNYNTKETDQTQHFGSRIMRRPPMSSSTLNIKKN